MHGDTLTTTGWLNGPLVRSASVRPLGTARLIYHRPTTSTYTATLEPGAASQEEHDFTNVATTRFPAPATAAAPAWPG